MPDESDIIGTRPPARDQFAGLPLALGGNPTVAEAEAEIRRDFQEPEAPEVPEPNRTLGDPLTKDERDAVVRRLQAIVKPGLLALAKGRVNLPLASTGVTAADVRRIADLSPFARLLGTRLRAWSWVGPWLATLAREGELVALRVEGMTVKRRVPREERAPSHGNEHVVYAHPSDPRVAALRSA